MNEICNILRIYKLDQLLAVTDQEVLIKSGEKPLTVYPDNAELEITPDKSDSGFLCKIDKIYPISKLPSHKSMLFPVPVPAIVEGETSTGKKIIIGTPEFPASVYIIPNIQKDQLSITCSMLKSPF